MQLTNDAPSKSRKFGHYDFDSSKIRGTSGESSRSGSVGKRVERKKKGNGL